MKYTYFKNHNLSNVSLPEDNSWLSKVDFLYKKKKTSNKNIFLFGSAFPNR